MSTQELLLARLPTTSEINLATVIEEFARSRTVDELHEGIENMIANLNPETQGITPAGFRWTLKCAIDMSRPLLEDAKNMFIREQYDDIEWERLAAVLERIHPANPVCRITASSYSVMELDSDSSGDDSDEEM